VTPRPSPHQRTDRALRGYDHRLPGEIPPRRPSDQDDGCRRTTTGTPKDRGYFFFFFFFFFTSGYYERGDDRPGELRLGGSGPRRWHGGRLRLPEREDGRSSIRSDERRLVGQDRIGDRRRRTTRRPSGFEGCEQLVPLRDRIPPPPTRGFEVIAREVATNSAGVRGRGGNSSPMAAVRIAVRSQPAHGATACRPVARFQESVRRKGQQAPPGPDDRLVFQRGRWCWNERLSPAPGSPLDDRLDRGEA